MVKNTISYILLVWTMVVLCTPAYAHKKERIKQIWHSRDGANPNIHNDSIVFYYSGNRGSVFNVNNFEGAYYGFRADNITGSSLYPACNMPTPVRDIFAMDVLPDSLLRQTRVTDNDKNPVVQTFHMVYAHDSLLTDLRTSRDADLPNSRNTIRYNEAGQPVSIQWLILNKVSKQMDTSTLRHIYYSADKRILADTLHIPGALQQFAASYEYDSAGRIFFISEHKWFQPISVIHHKRYTYDTAGNINKIEYFIFDEDVWVPEGKEELQYDAANHLTKQVAYDADNKIAYTRHLDYTAAGDPKLMEVHYYTNEDIFSCQWIEFYFNSHHNPDSAITWSDHCKSGFTKKETTIYIYQSYGSDVDDDSSAFTPMRKPFIYPVPARDLLHIKWHRDYTRQPIEIKLYNATGQEMRRYSITNPQLTDDLDISGLAAGVYTLRINTADTNEYIYSGKIVLL